MVLLACTEMADNWSHEETNDPLHAGRRDFYKVEKWSRDGLPHYWLDD